ncbi:MAG TPA: nuclear transport factor 2 family protein [Candidatus Dormibacteraeota bacterium]|jgi:ketosteroid isomerase-like protein|nr:nuclear transport factor 2 family protein [Candidatus Dormibacteraeota bacterium]
MTDTVATGETTELRDMLDRAAVREVMVRYAAGLDSRDFDAVRNCFTEDAQASYNRAPLAPGADAIVAYVRAVANLQSTMHSVTNVVVELDGDTAECDTACIAHLVRRADDGELTILIRGLRYRDRLVRQGTAWRIQHREHHAEWMHSVPGTPV